MTFQKQTIAALAVSLVLALTACAQSLQSDTSAPAPALTTTYAFASVEEGAAALTADDEFMEVVSAADMALRVRRAGATKEELRAVYAGAPQAWTDAERARLNGVLTRHAERLNQLTSWLPARVLLIKTNGAADTALPHTRGDAINMGPALPEDDSELDSLFFHELFHVLSRRNATRHDEMYAIVGFQPCSIALPETLRAQTITNPDAPLVRHAAPLGQDRFVTPILFADPPVFDPAHPDFGHYFDLRFLAAARDANGACALALENGEPVVVAQQEAVAAIHAAAGRNTDYVLHPEELLADNFSQAMMGRTDAPNPEVQQRLLSWLGLSG